MAGRVELRIEVETQGAEQLTALRRELDQLGTAGTGAFKQLDQSFVAVLDKLTLSRSLVADSTRSFLDSQRELFAGLAPLFSGFFRSVFTGARSLRDALKRLWADFLDFFLGIVRRMVAGWLSGLQSLGGAPGGFGVGGLVGGLLGGILGPATGGLFGGTPSTFPASFGGPPSLGLGLILGPAGRIAGLGGGAPLGGVASLGGLASLLGLAGFGLAGAGIRGGNVALGGLGGFLAGGALGTLIGGSSALAGTFLGAFAGPIGAAIGALVGVLFGSLRRGKLKRQASQIADQGFAEMRRVIRDFEQFRLDYDTALAQVSAIWQPMVAAWSQMGSIGRRSIQSQQPWFEQVVRRLNDIQSARQQRAQLIGALPLPEFQFGGLVQPIHAPQGRVLAFLHQGEAVLNRRAVQALGQRTIEEFNREPSRATRATSGDQFFITIQAVDGESVERWLARNEARVVRFLRRAARDRGMPSPF